MNAITSMEFPFYIVIGLAGLPIPIGIFAGLYYNYRTFAIVRRIQSEYRAHGRKWLFWRDRRRVIAFVLNPDLLLGEVPELAQTLKAKLVAHRRTLKTYLIRMFAYMFGSFGLAVALLLVLAYIRR